MVVGELGALGSDGTGVREHELGGRGDEFVGDWAAGDGVHFALIRHLDRQVGEWGGVYPA